MDLQLFEFQKLIIPDSLKGNSNLRFLELRIEQSAERQNGREEMEGNLYYACCGEDYWCEMGMGEEAKISAMAQKVDQFASFLNGSSGITKSKAKKGNTPFEQNLSRLNKALISFIPQILPSSYHGTAMYDR